MDKIEKFLKKLSKKEYLEIKIIIFKIFKKSFVNLDIKKLKGEKNKFRIRVGKIKIIFFMKKKNIFLLKIVRRNDKTYKK